MEEEMESRRVQENFLHSHRRKREKPMSLESQISLYSFLLFSRKWTRWGWWEEARKSRAQLRVWGGDWTGLLSTAESHTHTHTHTTHTTHTHTTHTHTYTPPHTPPHTHDLKSLDSWNVLWPWRRLWLLDSVSCINPALLPSLLLVEDPDLNLTDIRGHLYCVRHGWVDSSNQRVTFCCPIL